MPEMTKIYLSSIAAMAQNRAIGRDNTLLWHIPEDLKHFKKTTMGKPMVMGRKTYESFGRPLPGRPNIVVSRSFKDMPHGEASKLFEEMDAPPLRTAQPARKQGDEGGKENEGPFLYASIEDGIAAAKSMAAEKGLDEIFITGGGEIYRQTLPATDRLYLTLIHKDYEGDTFFPEFDWNDWAIIAQDRREGDPAFTFFTLERKK